MTSATAVIQEARSWLGVPYLHQGRSRHGVECLGLVLEVGRATGFLDPKLDWTNYGRLPLRSFLEQQVAAHCRRVESAGPGSLVVIKWTRVAAHLALCTGDTIIHACASRKQVVEHGYRGVITYGGIGYSIDRVNGAQSTGEPAYELTCKRLT